jgi:hypothetical protein
MYHWESEAHTVMLTEVVACSKYRQIRLSFEMATLFIADKEVIKGDVGIIPDFLPFPLPVDF